MKLKSLIGALIAAGLVIAYFIWFNANQVPMSFDIPEHEYELERLDMQWPEQNKADSGEIKKGE